MTDRITFDDCCRIILEDWPLRQDDVEPALRDYRRNLLVLLTKEFGVCWNDNWRSGHERPDDLPAVLSTMPKGYASLRSPFAGWMEYSPLPGEAKILEGHQSGLNAAENAYKERWVALFRDLLLLRWPEAATRNSSWTRLRSMGLGEQVDEIDFF